MTGGYVGRRARRSPLPVALPVSSASVAVLLAAIVAALTSPSGVPGGEAGPYPSWEAGSRPKEAPPFEYALPLNPFALSEPDLVRALDLAEDAGATTITTGAAWWYVEPERGTPKRWGPLDRLVDEAARRGLEVRVQVSGTPDWVHPYLSEQGVSTERRIWHPPRGEGERELFEGFLSEMAARYGGRISAFELWNEPNYAVFWEPAHDAAEYASLLRGAHAAIKGADPEARVVFGGISMLDADFLEDFYEAARAYPEAEEEGYFFDELNAHPYTYGQSPEAAAAGSSEGGSSTASLDERDGGPGGIGVLKETMVRNGDSGKNVFVGEFGYSTSDTWMSAVPDGLRAQYLVSAYRAARSQAFVSGLSWYGFVPGDTAGPEWTILDESLRPNETYDAYRRVAAEAQRTTH